LSVQILGGAAKWLPSEKMKAGGSSISIEKTKDKRKTLDMGKNLRMLWTKRLSKRCHPKTAQGGEKMI